MNNFYRGINATLILVTLLLTSVLTGINYRQAFASADPGCPDLIDNTVACDAGQTSRDDGNWPSCKTGTIGEVPDCCQYEGTGKTCIDPNGDQHYAGYKESIMSVSGGFCGGQQHVDNGQCSNQ